MLAYAEKQGWAIMRGGTPNLITTANLLIREKGSSGYQFGLGNVPCYFGTPNHPIHTGDRWSQVNGRRYVASPKNIGPGAGPRSFGRTRSPDPNGPIPADRLSPHSSGSPGTAGRWPCGR